METLMLLVLELFSGLVGIVVLIALGAGVLWAGAKLNEWLERRMTPEQRARLTDYYYKHHPQLRGRGR